VNLAASKSCLRSPGRLRRLLDFAVVWLWLLLFCARAEAVVPVLVGPLQALLAILPSLLLALAGLLLAVFRPSGFVRLVRFFWHQKVFTLVLAGVVVGTVMLSRSGAGGPEATAEKRGTAWPLFRGGPDRRGAVPGADEPVTSEALWTFNADARIIYASPAVVGNRVYVTTADKGVFSDRGAVLCLDAETGAEVWRHAPEDFRATFSSPAVTDGYVVCGEGLHYTTDARITCLDTSGKLRWELRTQSHVESSPCIHEGRVYVGGGDDGMYCINLVPREDGTPNVVWHLAGERYPDCESSPVVHDGVVYFGLGMGGRALCAVDAKTGKELWRLDAPYPVFGPPTVADGRLIIGMGNGNFIETAEQMRARVVTEMRRDGRPEAEIVEAEKKMGPAGEVWSIDLASRRVVWRYRLPRTVLGAVAAADGVLYFGSRDGRLTCLSSEGKMLGRWDAREPLLSSPAVGEGHVYFATASGRLHCLRRKGLEPVWERALGAGANYLSSPVVALGHVYVGTDGDGLRCIGRPGGAAPTVWSAGWRGGTDASALAAEGTVSWTYPSAGDRRFAVTAPLLPLDDGVAVACTHDGKNLLLKLQAGDGIPDGERAVWAAVLPNPVTVAPARVGDSLLVVDGSPGQEGRTLRCLSVSEGKERWLAAVAPDGSGQFALDGRRIFVWVSSDTVLCLSPRGEPLWSTPVGKGRVTPAPGSDIVVVATDEELLALDDASGKELWRVALADAPRFAPARRGVAIVLATAKGVSSHSMLDGRRLWSAEVGAIAVPPVVDNDRIAVVTEGGEMLLLRPVEGSVAVRAPAAAVPPLLVGERVLFAAKGLMLLPGAGGTPAPWVDTTGLGRPVTPLVLSDSQVTLATDARGVVCLSPRR
jgi:outer membrane protein assembly factor BamB